MTMGGFEQIYEDKASKKDDGNDAQHDQGSIMEGENDRRDSESSIGDSTSSSTVSSSSSADLIDDATSSTSSSSPSYGPLYELSELMDQLPIKRGLSKYYQGKSQTFGSLACVESLEDLAKKGRQSCIRRKLKSCKSYGGGVDNHSTYSPKATISKKTSSSRLSLLSSLGTRGTLFSSCKHPIFIPVQKNL
ncbi:hypothetical protein ACSBR2_005796 [Camellia fascicularis]